MTLKSVKYTRADGVSIQLDDYYLPRKVKIAIVQLQSPFYDEIYLDGIYRWYGSSEYYFLKIEKILLEIAKKKPDIVVFPEYTIPNDKLNEIKKHAHNFKILIAGSDVCRDEYNVDLYEKNVCPIFIKDNVYFIEKKILAADEEGAIAGEEDRNSLKLMCKIKGGADGSDVNSIIQIYICQDYLLDHDAKNLDFGLVIVTMCSDKTEDFVNYAKVDSKKRKFTVLCNTYSNNCEYIGKSSVYGPNTKTKFPLIEKIFAPKEGYILAGLNLGAHVLSFGIGKENPVSFHEVYYFDKNYAAKKIENVANNTIYNFDLVKSDCCSIQFPAAAYPPILLKLLKQKHLIKAIAFYNKDEKFWSGKWGKKLNEPAINRENTRIFVINDVDQLKDLYNSVLIEHSSKYKVFVINEDIAKKEANCFEDFVIIEDKGEKIVAKYLNDDDEIIDKKVLFSLNLDLIEKTGSIFEETVKKATRVYEETSYERT